MTAHDVQVSLFSSNDQLFAHSGDRQVSESEVDQFLPYNVDTGDLSSARGFEGKNKKHKIGTVFYF